jgi:hypothetical protein
MFFLGRIIWPDPADAQAPTSGQLPFFILLAAIESLTSGLGVALLIFGWKWINNSPPESKTLDTLTLLSFVWLLGQWWPHGNLHRVNGMDLQGLLYIDYGFHVTIIIASCIVLYAFVKTLLKNQNHA